MQFRRGSVSRNAAHFLDSILWALVWWKYKVKVELLRKRFCEISSIRSSRTKSYKIKNIYRMKNKFLS